MSAYNYPQSNESSSSSSRPVAFSPNAISIYFTLGIIASHTSASTSSYRAHSPPPTLFIPVICRIPGRPHQWHQLMAGTLQYWVQQYRNSKTVRSLTQEKLRVFFNQFNTNAGGKGKGGKLERVMLQLLSSRSPTDPCTFNLCLSMQGLNYNQHLTVQPSGQFYFGNNAIAKREPERGVFDLLPIGFKNVGHHPLGISAAFSYVSSQPTAALDEHDISYNR
ncbi:hypothetical protein BDQ17DRAFT_1536708 [Cyathus striatus]|nr:hypothetical protein BDQ17DRAFT_1536708 [Cyathus striatus]